MGHISLCTSTHYRTRTHAHARTHANMHRLCERTRTHTHITFASPARPATKPSRPASQTPPRAHRWISRYLASKSLSTVRTPARHVTHILARDTDDKTMVHVTREHKIEHDRWWCAHNTCLVRVFVDDESYHNTGARQTRALLLDRSPDLLHVMHGSPQLDHNIAASATDICRRHAAPTRPAQERRLVGNCERLVGRVLASA